MGEPAPGSYHDQGRYAPQFEEVGSDVDHEEYEASNLNVEAVSDPPGSEEEGQRQATLEELLIGMSRRGAGGCCRRGFFVTLLDR